jgi:imidazolonepropionase-like amidohydrolase
VRVTAGVLAVLTLTSAGPELPGLAFQGAVEAAAQAPASSETVTVLEGATIVQGTGAPPIVDGVVVVGGDRITCVGSRTECEAPQGATRVDVAGRFITPGLVDAHVHFSQTGWLDGRPDGMDVPDIYPYAETAAAAEANPDRWHGSYLCSGITAVYDTGGHPWTTALPAASEDRTDRAHVRTSGPLVTFASRPQLNLNDEVYTFLPMSTDEEAAASVDRLVAMGSTAVKVWFLRTPPDRRAALENRLMQIGERARDAGLDLIVHATGLREAKAALRAGAAMLVHSVEDQLVDEEFLELARSAEVVYAPTLRVGANWSRARISAALNRPAAIDDPNRCVDAELIDRTRETARLQPRMPEAFQDDLEGALGVIRRNGRTEAIMAENLRRVRAAGVTVATATDAGNPMTLHGPSIYEEMEAMQEAGIPAAEVVVLSTRNGARAMRRLADFGTLAPGKIADILVLTEDPTRDVRAFRSLSHVMRGGVLRTQEELRQR